MYVLTVRSSPQSHLTSFALCGLELCGSELCGFELCGFELAAELLLQIQLFRTLFSSFS
jgi:hypothetical protein